MRAEVANLSRNIVVQGDCNSEENQYGAHIMMLGKSEDGTEGRFENIEIRNAG